MSSYCTECGTLLVEKELEGEGLVPYCEKCGQYRFPLYNVAVSMIVIDESTGKILLIQQYGRPVYILVAGYVNRGEKLEDAAVREIAFHCVHHDVRAAAGSLIIRQNHRKFRVHDCKARAAKIA